VSAAGQDIHRLYFEFGPVAAHRAGCPQRGSDVWEVTRHQDKHSGGETRRTTLRYACHRCGAVAFETFDGPDAAFEPTHATQTGYGAGPERVAGLWLWPGPRIWPGDARGPLACYVTRGKDRPRRPEDTVGVVGWHLGRRGGIKWSAGLGCTDHHTVTVSAGQDFASRRAAVAWIAAQLTAGAR